MNKHDKDNLKFLMTCPQSEFEKWMDEASQDDIDYAVELIRKAKAELMLEEMALREVSESEDFTEAKALIERIKNVGKI